MKILVTGMSGLIGGLAGRKLAESHEVVALNRRPIKGVRCFQADINDLDAIKPAFEGVDAVVHMAAYLGDDIKGHLSTNIGGVHNVLEASRLARVKRVVLGSSGATVMGYEREPEFRPLVEARWADVRAPRPMLTHLSLFRPNGVYGAAKLFGEALGRYYSDFHDMSVICIRIGRVVEEDWPRDPRHAAAYCSHRDIVQMVEKCVNASPSVRFDIFYAVSDNRGRFRDINHAREVIGYVPLDGVKDWPLAKPG
ncbi:MAG: NAD(P)-dependent oxidoreductase [Chloroflexi bacterium]|nr:NAD(P)-dependent oxidoreductase [Chloroflexota bacterium]